MTAPRAHRRQLAAAVVLVPVVVGAALATPAYVRAVSVPCPGEVCEPIARPSATFAAALDRWDVPVEAWAVTVAVLAWAQLLLAVAVALLLPRSRAGGLLVLVTAALLTLGAAVRFAQAAGWTWAVVGANLLVAVLVPLFVGLFPDGRWRPRWFRWLWPLPAAVVATSLAGSALVAPGVGESDALAVVELATWLGLLALVVARYRGADGVTRRQVRVLLPFVVLVLGTVALAGAADAAGLLGGFQPVAVLLDEAALAVLAAGTLVALFRHRLYDADVAVRRTAVYAGAVVALAVLYVLLVAGAAALTGDAAAPALGGVAAGVLALAGGLAAFALRDRLRRRLFGGHGLARALAVVAGGRAPEPGADVAATIAHGLGLAHVTVRDRTGAPVWSHGPPGDGPLLREPVVDAGGATVGTLLLAPPGGRGLDRHHRRVLDEVVPFVVLVLRAREEAQELRVARTAAAGAREDERRRLRRELHDGVGPLLASQLLTLDTMRVVRTADARPELLGHLEGQARAAIGEVRRLAQDLRPAALDRGGLPAALAAEAERLSLSGLPVRLDVHGPDGTDGPDGAPLPAATEVALLRIAQEALANVVKHADATGARVTLTVAEVVELVVTDDGRGGAGRAGGVGTATMRERAVELGGALEIGPGPGGRGTRVQARIPR